MYPEQSNRGQKHAATEPSASLRSAAGSDSDENCRPTSSHGKKPVSVLSLFVNLRFIYFSLLLGKVVMKFIDSQNAIIVLRFMSFPVQHFRI